MRLLVLAVLLLGCLGCKEKKVTQATTPGAVTTVVADAFADVLSAEMTRCDEDRVTALLDPDLATKPGAAHLVCTWMQGIQSYKLVSLHANTTPPAIVMRRLLVDPTSNSLLVNYDRVDLERKNQDNLPRTLIVDMFSYRQARSISEVLASKTPHPDVEKARELIGSGKQDEAMAIVEKLPVNLRRDLMLRAYLQAFTLPAPEKKQARDELAKAFPDDPAIALTMIDAGFALADYDSVQHWCDVLVKDIGQDAYLVMQKAIAYLQAGKLDDAQATAADAVRLEPTLTRAHEVLLDALIAQKKWPEVLAEMTELETNHGQQFDEAKLRAEPRLAELVSQPAFAEWLAKRK
jgi:hypothetical protein